MKIYHYSVGRSGCTFISQLLAELFGLQNLEAGHERYTGKTEEPVVISIRDFRDVVLSFWRVHNDIPFKEIESGRQASLAEIEPQISMVKASIQNHLLPTYKDNKHVLLLRYEQFFPDQFDYLFTEFEKFFSIKVGKKKRTSLKLAYSFNRNKHKSQKMQSFKEYDKEFIHGLHCYQGKVGGWKDLLVPEAHAQLNLLFAGELREWGFSEL